MVDSFVSITNPMLEYIQSFGFTKGQFEYAAAMGWIYFAFTFVVCMLVFAVMRKRVFNMGERS